MSLKTQILALAQTLGTNHTDLISMLTDLGPVVGEVREYAGATAPYGWAIAAGQVLSIVDYPALFAVIGTIYGGDGVDTFALPDFQNRVAIGASLTHTLGAVGGNATVSLNADNLPAHTHGAALDLSGVTPVTTVTVGTAPNGNFAVAANNGGLTQSPNGGGSSAFIFLPADVSPTNPQNLGGVNTVLDGAGAVTVGGNATDHTDVNVLPPYLSVNKIIYLG